MSRGLDTLGITAACSRFARAMSDQRSNSNGSLLRLSASPMSRGDTIFSLARIGAAVPTD